MASAADTSSPFSSIFKVVITPFSIIAAYRLLLTPIGVSLARSKAEVTLQAPSAISFIPDSAKPAVLSAYMMK